MTRRRPPRPDGWYGALRYLGVGLTMAASVAGGLLLGVWLDGRFGTAPWLAMTFLVIGAAAGFRELYRVLRAWQREEDGET